MQTVAALSNFFLCMILFPEVQKKAQAEIDAVVGSGRLPTIADRDSLPYVCSVQKEVLRWRPVVPMGAHFPASPSLHCRLTAWPVSHSVSQDDVYRGYRFPAGTALVSNIWCVTLRVSNNRATFTNISLFSPARSERRAALHDDAIYSDPDAFRPERYLAPECAPDSANWAFGFGRR